MEHFVTVDNNFVKSFILDVTRVSGYNDSYNQPLDTVPLVTGNC